MKNVIRMLLLAAGVLVVGAVPAMAYHDGGVAHCNGCHTMHNSENGVPMNSGTPQLPVGSGYDDLLLFGNKTDVCLSCHAGNGSYHVWSTDVLAPSVANRGGGDFVFLEEDNINDAHAGASNPILGHAAGHSVVSAMMGTPADPVLTMSPGGAYPAVDLACTSCHDPHGTDAFRLTYKAGQQTVSDTGTVINWTATITGIPRSLFGPADESNTSHNVYQSGYSEWCASCHGDFHAASGNLVHPSGELLDIRQVQVYNAYRGTTDCVNNPPMAGSPCGSGTFTGAYLHWVPIQDATIMATSYANGATNGSSYVACVSCHRAHATSAPNAGRWDFSVTGLAEDGEESGAYTIPNPYDGYQRSLCNKCHAQDEFDALVDYTP